MALGASMDAVGRQAILKDACRTPGKGIVSAPGKSPSFIKQQKAFKPNEKFEMVTMISEQPMRPVSIRRGSVCAEV
jgi:hypothetical protein